MAFDEAVILVDPGDGLHFGVGQWFTDHSLQGAEILRVLH